jgi:tetratricopeptide (TPR) repeat protein
MKPRTFRRVVLLGSLGAIVLILAFGYFVVRPWQNHRQLEAMRTDGLAAYDAGDLKQAERLLGRYKNNAEDPEAEIFLKHARARETVEVTDGGHISVAINSYREYLRRVPDDLEAKQELLPLMNTRGMFVEAESLARELIQEHDVSTIEVLEELSYALSLQGKPAAEREPVLLALSEHPERTFHHKNTYLIFLRSEQRSDESDALLDYWIAEEPESIEVQLLELQRYITREELDSATAVMELTSIIGLNPDSGSWDDSASVLSPSAAWFVNRMFNGFRRPDLATTVQLRTAREHSDWLNTVWAARRLYWAGRDDELRSLEVLTENGEPDADLIGYQYLSAVRDGDEERAEELEAELRDIQYDRRAPAWIAHIEGSAASDESNFIEARLKLKNSIEWYPMEPTFRVRVGEQHLSEGQFQDAIDEWVVASEIVNDQVGAEFRFDVRGWTEPIELIINAYAAQDRLIEATEYIQELARIAPNDGRVTTFALNAMTELARRRQLPRQMGLEFLELWEEQKAGLDPADRIELSPSVAIILASIPELSLARDEIRFALQSAGDNAALVTALLEVDDQFGLGVASGLGIDTRSLAQTSPLGALRVASELYEETGDLEAGIQVIREGLEAAEISDRRVWQRVLVGFVDEYNPARAKPLWDNLIEESPDDLEILYLAIESNAFGNNPEFFEREEYEPGDNLKFIDEQIERVVALTEAQGQTLPSRLRLARASAIVANPEERTKATRDRALEIVRSVVTAEPNYTKARNMLGRLLALPPTPGLNPSDRYTPDYEGAIEQYQTLARQLSGSVAQAYLLESVDLAYRQLGNERLAESLLDEYIVLFDDDLRSLPAAAVRYENIGVDSKAASIYQRLIEVQDLPAAMLSLAELRLKQGQRAEAQSLLARASEQPMLNSPSLLNLAGLYVRTGNLREGELIASSGARYGLDPLESLLVHAEFAELYLSPDQEIEILKDALALDETNLTGWKRLVRRMIELGNLAEAKQLYDEALTKVEEDTELARLGVLTQGAPQTAREMLALPGMQESPMLRQALERVEAYSSTYSGLGGDEELQARVDALRQLIEDFTQIQVVQKYAVQQLARLSVNAGIIAELADRALRNAPSDTDIMGIAGESYLRAGQPEAAIRVVDLWRTNSLETTIVSNAIRARAMIQMDDLEGAQRELESFVDLAYQTPSDPISREVLDAFSYVRLSQGEDPSVTAQRLQPLLAADREIRSRVWLGLAANVVQSPEVGAEWIRIASDYSDEEDHVFLANAWVSLAFTHEEWDPEFAREALELVMPIIDGGEDVLPHIYTIAARANLIDARGSADESTRSSRYIDVVDLMLAAGEAGPTNLMPLLDAARYAQEGKLYERTIDIYERLIAMGIQNDGLNAMISNNLAMTLVRAGLDEQRGQQAVSLAEDATSLQSQIPSYWGTRGWVELELGRLEDALASFQTSTRLDADNPEGWVGVLIASRGLGDARLDLAEVALERVRVFLAEGRLNDELMGLLSANGLNEPELRSVP